jgi:hypothetical protein
VSSQFNDALSIETAEVVDTSVCELHGVTSKIIIILGLVYFLVDCQTAETRKRIIRQNVVGESSVSKESVGDLHQSI